MSREVGRAGGEESARGMQEGGMQGGEGGESGCGTGNRIRKLCKGFVGVRQGGSMSACIQTGKANMVS